MMTNFNIKLYKHQEDLLKLNPKKHLLAWETGTGKTIALIALGLHNNPENEPCLVITIKSDKEKWLNDEFKKYNLNWTVLYKEEFKKLAPTLPRYNRIIIDEAHHFFGMQGFRKRSMMLRTLLAYIKKHDPEYIFPATATPYLSSPNNIFALSLILGEKWKYPKFKNYFFSMVNMGRSFPVPIIKKNINSVPVEKIVSKLISQLGSTVKMEDCVYIPEQTFQVEYFNLTREQEKGIEVLDDIHQIVVWTKIHQICGGTLKGDEYTESKFFKSEKLTRLLELIVEYKKLIIVCRYTNEVKYLKESIEKKFKNKKIFEFTGATSKDRIKLAKKADGLDECIIIANAFCGTGYELPSFPLMIFYSYDFSLPNYLQMIGRIKRINKMKKNVYLSLVVKNSIDEDVYKKILNKESFDIEIYSKERKIIYD